MNTKMAACVFAIAPFFLLTAYAAEGNFNVINDGATVKLHYTLKVEGEVVESTGGREPFEFVYGTNPVIPGFKRELKGLKAGEQKAFTLLVQDAYGEVDPSAVAEVSRDQFPEGSIEPGMMFATLTPAGGQLRGVVRKVDGANVTVDFNHPLAGKTLHFDVEIVEVIAPAP